MVLTIRDEQLLKMSRDRRGRFVRDMVRHLQEAFPHHLRLHRIQSQALETIVHDGMIDAERIGIILEDDIQRFLEFIVILGPDWPEDKTHSWAVETLVREDLTGEERLDLMEEYIILNWEEPPHGPE